jgi:hypothetical protein
MDQSNIKVGLENSTAIVCDECGSQTFKEVTYLRRISRLLTGAPEDMIVPIPAFACSNCNHVNEQFQLKDQKNQIK